MNNDTKRGSDKLVARYVAYLQAHLFGPPTRELPPPDLQWQVDSNSGKLTISGGSPNQKWLLVACLLLHADQRIVAAAVDYSVKRYTEERNFGHWFNETMSPSHAWQHLTAHVAVRDWLCTQGTFGNQFSRELWAANTDWWSRTAWLLRRFWSPTVRRGNRRGGVVSVGARATGQGNFPSSSQMDAFGEYFAGGNKIRQPRNLGQTDTLCQEWAQRLIDDGDDLGHSNPVEPKLLYPIHASTHGLARSWWEPRQVEGDTARSVLDPSYAVVETPSGDVEYSFAPTKLDGEFEEVGVV